MEFTHLYSLGPIAYAIHDFSIEHTYCTKALGVTARYPSFEDDSISGYAAWLHDLQTVLSPFFSGPEQDFVVIASRYMEEQQQLYAHDIHELNYRATQEPTAFPSIVPHLCRFPCTSGRQRNFSSSGLSFPSTVSAMISPAPGPVGIHVRCHLRQRLILALRIARDPRNVHSVSIAVSSPPPRRRRAVASASDGKVKARNSRKFLSSSAVTTRWEESAISPRTERRSRSSPPRRD